MSLIEELAKGNPADFVTVAWDGDILDHISVTGGWQDQVHLLAICRHVVDEVNSRMPASSTRPIRIQFTERGLGLGDMGRLAEVLKRYNTARRAARDSDLPVERITEHGAVDLLWYGDQLTGIRIDPEYAAGATAQRLSTELTNALTGMSVASHDDSEVSEAEQELRRFLG